MGKPIAHFCCGESMPVALAVHPQNGYIACGCVDGSVVLWNAEGGQLVWTSRPYASRITDVAFSGDGSLLYGATLDGQFCAWNVASGASDLVMHGETNGSTIDSITVTERNLVCTTGRSLRGIVI
jgi:WD40 repeat protein